jgi:hypothetical protein
MSEAGRIRALRIALKAIAYRRPAGPIRRCDPMLAEIIEDIETLAQEALQRDHRVAALAREIFLD